VGKAPNLVHSVEEKMSKTIKKEGIIKQLKSQKPNTQVWACARFQLNVTIIKRKIQNDVKKRMFMHTL
jgi:hypothetical protein